ncbi:MAG: hypothetical protein BYD32DRAFT_287407 [Podila humilis]|nr:MAG: hypothetical protein BYD32DRAFT_287407 [Podila humilis]
MPSFLKRLASVAGKSTRTPTAQRHPCDAQKNEQVPATSNTLQDKRNSNLSNISASSATSGSSRSGSPTVSSLSSLSLSSPTSPSATTSCGPSRQQSTEALRSGPFPSVTPQEASALVDTCPQQQQQQQQIHKESNQSRYSQHSRASNSSGNLPDPASTPKNHPSTSSLSALFHPRSRSMPMLGDVTTSARSVLVPVSRASVENLLSPHTSNARPLSLMLPTSTSSVSQGKKSRPKSFSGLLLQHEQQLPETQPPAYQPKSARWASRGGIGTKNEMIDLETSGVFVPSNAKRLRPEFVYRTIILCADEIRNRGLSHPNIFYNPSPKKTISAMISLLTDQERADLYPIQCLRIDTVANLMLNLLSQMSNPVIPYTVMEFYFRHGASTPTSPSSGGNSVGSSIESTHPRLPPIPPLPSLKHSPKFASSTIAWSRQCFDLSLFLDSLPSLNRVILLEVLHLCAEILNHQIQNNLTMIRLIQQFAPALFSTVSDQKVLAQVIGSRRCSIHDSAMSAQDGRRAENHLFTVILSRFMYMTSMANEGPAFLSQPMANHLRDDGASTASSLPGGEHEPYASSQASYFRKSQERIQQAQQEYYHNLEKTFQEMELLGQPSQHFGQYGAAPRQSRSASPLNGTPQGRLAYKQSERRIPQEGGRVEQLDFNLPQPSIATRPHRNHTWHDRNHDANRQIAV